eukprot:CAMPEP_0202694118 /NCGR_PEP_ID=MMETSP1385-20130828/8060_1 /ASSEMBLY_ACC=CAM_ASM_000861 /TAXON_ID=933848 /ORGANISM="Elphidium margaritaceum" /LENGTH=213 /DNA_ID=CAMNT_0049349901 /DNA_START=28 /DNA_END=669 /DNA_ORIENTATION=+
MSAINNSSINKVAVNATSMRLIQKTIATEKAEKPGHDETTIVAQRNTIDAQKNTIRWLKLRIDFLERRVRDLSVASEISTTIAMPLPHMHSDGDRDEKQKIIDSDGDEKIKPVIIDSDGDFESDANSKRRKRKINIIDSDGDADASTDDSDSNVKMKREIREIDDDGYTSVTSSSPDSIEKKMLNGDLSAASMTAEVAAYQCTEPPCKKRRRF